MKKIFIGIFLLGILTSLMFVSYNYYQYWEYYKADDDNSIFFNIPSFLGTYSMVNNHDKLTYSKEDFYSFVDSYYNDSLYIGAFPAIRFLKQHKADIRFHYYPDSNYFVLYDIGIDGQDDSLKGKVFEKLPYYYSLIMPKGDIFLGAITVPDICDNRNGNNWYFKNGQRVAVKPMDSIIAGNVYPDVISSIQNDFVVGDSILLLFSLRYLEFDQIWQSKLLCNWGQTDSQVAKNILLNFEKRLSEKKLYSNADSIVYNFSYWKTNKGIISDIHHESRKP